MKYFKAFEGGWERESCKERKQREKGYIYNFFLFLSLCLPLSWSPAGFLLSQNNAQFMRQAEGHAL